MKIDKSVLSSSSWVSIPKAYIENASLSKSIIPLFVFSMLPTILTNWAAGADPGPLDTSLIDNGNFESTLVFLSTRFFEQFETVLDIASIFVLVRLAKVIGAERDEIIAQKIDEACRKYPDNSNFVVVIGMLHCNGVARKLLTSA
jgi:hypothetical protein